MAIYQQQLLISLCLAVLATADEQSFCGHYPTEIKGMVKQRTSDTREKRMVNHQPIRISFHYANISLLNANGTDILQNVVIPALDTYFSTALKVIPATSNILLQRDCDTGTFFTTEPISCVNQCAPSFCGPSQIPEEHLERCVECNGGGFLKCATRPGSADGPGVAADLVIYVSADCTGIPNGVVAFAGACQLESELNRPIAGFINFCPTALDSFDEESLFRIGVHEMMHALAFSEGLFPWFRDENGNPRTPRDAFGTPSGISNTTVRTVNYINWQTFNGEIEHEVSLFVTPSVIEQARLHFDCPTLEGVELENQGGTGTAGSHWEQRVLGNEGMGGFLFFTLPFSRITFGLLQDSGWYKVDYDQADALAWGLNTGCTIPQGSCREHIDLGSPSPFCTEFQDNTVGCTVDHKHLSLCNLDNIGSLPPDFQFFDSTGVLGGRAQTTDYCPFETALSGGSCVDPLTASSISLNTGQTYGADSRCFNLGEQPWTKTDTSGIVTTYGFRSGCYQFSCTSSGLEIVLEGIPFQCACEGAEIVVDLTKDGVRYQGSFICPSCASVCYDNITSCPNIEPPGCPGSVVQRTVTITTDPCGSAPCDPTNGVCTQDGDGGFICECMAPFEGNGTTCTYPDPCLLEPCDINAMCTRTDPLTGNFTCECIAPFEGDGMTCSFPNPCLNMPCDPNAECSRTDPLTGNFTCECIAPFEGNGMMCMFPDPCLSEPCDPNAECMREDPLTGGYTCECELPYEGNGTQCSINVPDPCLMEPCGTNAVCTRDSPQNAQYACSCIPPYEEVSESGDGSGSGAISCEIPDPCDLHPCDVNAVCIRVGPNSENFTCTCLPPYNGNGFTCSGMTMGADPHFSVVLPSKKLLCFSVMGEHGFSYNLISNNKLVMNALFSPDSKREEVTWIGALGITAKTTKKSVQVSFSANPPLITCNKAKLSPLNIQKIKFTNNRLIVTDYSLPIVTEDSNPSVLVSIEDAGLNFTVRFMNGHLDLFWHDTSYHAEDSHGMIGQFFRKGVEIDEARKILLLPNKEPVPIMRRPVWAFMEREKRQDGQLCWTAMNPGYQGKGLIDGVYNDYLVENVTSSYGPGINRTPDLKMH